MKLCSGSLVLNSLFRNGAVYIMPQSHKKYLIITGKLTDKQTKRRYKRVTTTQAVHNLFY